MSNGNSKNKATDLAETATEDVQEHASNVADTVRNAVSSAGRAVSDGYQRVADTARDSYSHGRDIVRDSAQDVGRQVKRHPVSALAIAVGVGLIAGFLLRGSDGRHNRSNRWW